MMTVTSNSTLNIDTLCETLSDFSIDRSEIKYLLDHLPSDSELNRTSIEYELQLLKILAVGWSINYFNQDEPLKQLLSERYWSSIQQFSDNISSISSASINQAFNYFETIKQRLEIYLNEFSNSKQSNDLTAVIGPRFAKLCGHPENAIVIWMGSKLFQNVLNKINTYLSDAQFVSDETPSNTQSDNDK